MSKIAVVEQHYHPEYLIGLLQLLEDRFDDDSITVYTTKKVARGLSEKYRFDTRLHYIYDSLGRLGENDIVFLNTVQPSMKDMIRWKDIRFPAETLVFLTVHNLNAWVNTRFVPRLNLFHSFDSFMVQKYCKKLLDQVSGVIVVSDTLVDAARIRFPGKQVFCIPFKFAGSAFVVDDDKDVVLFGVPGGVDLRRREYQLLFDVFSRLYDEYPGVRLYLIGRDPWYRKHRKYPFVVCYEDYLDQVDYDGLVDQMDFIFCPSKPSTYTVNTVDEVYGVTKSFNIHDAVRARKPLILPRHLPVSKYLLSSVLYYDDEEYLFHLLMGLLMDRDRRMYLKQKAVENMEVFSWSKIQQYFDTCVLPVEMKVGL